MTSFSTIRSVVGAAALLSITSCGDGLVGIPSPTGRQTVTATTHDSAPPAHGKATVDLAAWDEVWGRIQANPEAVPVQAHWRVCGLKYRFRGYGQLFRCLDLLAARSGGSNFIERIYAPVLIGWMRAGAYAELGQTSEAFKWAEFAWRALPQAYRDARQIYADDAFGGAAITAGGSMWAEQGPSQMYALPAGWNNPAGLDLRPQAIVMDLAAERALFYYQTGNPDFANKALEDLNKWRNAPGFFDKVSFEDTAIMLSLSPLFAMGRYKDVVESYEQAGSRMNRLEQSNKFGRTFSNVLWLGLPSLLNKLTSPDDTRLFEVSLEDASHALLYSISLDKIGKRELSKKALDEILAVQESHDMGGIYWLILYERGQISLEEGKRQEAIEYFREAADAIELVRNNVEFEANKIGLATRTQAVYEALVSVLADEGNWKDAFLATERAKGRALVDLLAQVREFAPPRQTGGRADVGQLLTAAATNTRDSGLTGDSRNVETRGAVVSARRELGAISPETASLVSVRTESFDAIVARIAPEETLIAYFQAGDRLYGFVVSRLGTKGFLLAADGMHSEVRDFREAIENESEASRHIGETLYNRLIRPLEHEIRGGGALTISPHLILHYVPFAALFDGRQYLIDRYSLRITPSASALAYFAATGQGRQRRVLALGNPDLGDPRFDLPGAQKEAVAVAHLFPGSRALVRAEATKTAIIEMGGDFPMLHFASHGTFASDAPLTSGLLLARGQEPDGRLAVSDLYKLHLDADLVTLSGCETGLATIAGGDDLIGLTRGFFHAGARTVVASLWEVPDASTEKLMLSFYRNLGGLDKREALRHAAIETREIYPAPRHWAAFFLTGSAD